ncbi:MAG: DUF4349 domain-containing protein [Actinomycetota bacterium]|nr:DUF4349 domain-containing protein [Actinomycetota bacterium]
MAGSVRRRRKGACQLVCAASVLLFALVLPACGGEPSGAGGASAGDTPSGGSPGQAGGAEFASSGEEMAVAESGGQAAPQATAQALPADFDRKIIKTAELGVRVEEVRESAARAQQIAASYGGNVLSSRVSRDSDSVYADLTLSVPSSEFEATLDELRDLGKEVTTDAVTGEDVTEEFVDLESRERNLLAAEESLLRLYDAAKSVGDTLAVQRELTNVRGEIELVQGRIKYLEQRTAFSQITLTIEPVPDPSQPASSWDPAAVAARAWGASLGVLQALATAVISAFVFGWWLAPALLAGLLLWRRRSRGPTVQDHPPAP